MGEMKDDKMEEEMKYNEISQLKIRLETNELFEYIWQVSKASKKLKRTYKGLKQAGSKQDESKQAGSKNTSSNSAASSTGSPQSSTPVDPKTSAAPPSIGWDATMILAFLIVVFIAN